MAATELTSAYDEEPLAANQGAYDDAPSANDIASAAYTTEDTPQQNLQQPPPIPQDQQQGQGQHGPPAPPTFCQQMVNWFPLKQLSFFGGLALNVLLLLSVFLPPPIVNPFAYAVVFYLLTFGFVTMAIESPTFVCTRRCQLKIFWAARFLSRLWGRSFFYFAISILCYYFGAALLIVVGACLTIISLLNLLFSILSARKYCAIRRFIAAGSEGDELLARFERKFDELEGKRNDKKLDR